jgi:hypothetical protein
LQSSFGDTCCRRETMPGGIGSILMIILILLLVGVLPVWPHSRAWGPYPSGGIGLVLVILLILLLVGGL